MTASPATVARAFADCLKALESAVSGAEGGSITNARKLEALSQLEDLLPNLPKAEVAEHRGRFEDLCEKLLTQNATDPLRRLVVSVLTSMFRLSDTSALPSFANRLLQLMGDSKKGGDKVNDTKVAALDVMGQLVVHHGQSLEPFCNDILAVIAKHIKMNEASARCSALENLCRIMTAAGVRQTGTASNIWKMLQKVIADKALTVRTVAAHALSVLAIACPACAAANGEAMALACLKALATEDPPGQLHSSCSESRFAFTKALAKVLAAMTLPIPPADRSKKKPVTDFASGVDFLEQAISKGPSSGTAFHMFRSSVCMAIVLLAEAQGVGDAASLALVVRASLNALEMPPSSKSSKHPADEDNLMQVARQIQHALQRLLRLAQMEGCLNDFVEQGLLPVVSAQFHETSRSTDMRMLVVLETLCGACVASGETFRRIETKVTKPLLHIVGNYPNATVQLHAAYCLRCVGRGSPPQLFQLLSVLLNLSTVQNAEVLGTPLRRKDANGQMVAGDTAVAAAAAHADLLPLVRGLFGYCSALAAMSSELYSSELGVPHDVTSAVLTTSGALLQPHPSCAISAQRRCCAFLLLEGLMCLGSDWVGQRLTTLFALWKTALGKKPVDRAKVVYQEHVASSSSKSSSSDADNSANVCRDELLSLLFALRSLYAFTWHSRDTLLTTLPHLHKILVVFLTNISQLVVGLPHPTSNSFRAKYRQEASQQGAMRPITMAGQCGIPEILLMIRATMYRTFAAMQPSLYSSRFVPLLNMLADDVTRVLPHDFPVTEIITELAGQSKDTALDLVDSHLETSRDGSSTARLAVKKLLSCGAAAQHGSPFAEDLGSDAGAAAIFSTLHKESPGGTDCMLIPWDAWVDSTQPLAAQCVSAEWDWRCSSVKLLSIIINAAEVGEAPRAVVLQHLLKKKETVDEGNPSSVDRSCMAAVAILAYLREHVHLRGLRVAPPQQAIEQAMDMSLAGLKESNPILRRLHTEILAMLFFCHHQLPDSPVVPKILQHLASDSPQTSDAKDAAKTEERLKERSAIALLCGSILRAFAWGWSVLPPGGRGFHCPYIMNIVPILLKLAKETAQPVRLWMLYSLYIGMEAAGTAFAPFMKDALRLATAHLLADFFEAPLVLWVVAELTHAAAIVLDKNDSTECEGKEDHLLSGIWKVLQQVHHVQHGGNAFATVRAEAACLNTAPHLTRLIATENLLKLAAKKLGGEESGSQVCAVRTFAAQSLCQLATSGSDLFGLFPDRTQLFQLLDASKGAEAEALQELILAMLRANGLTQLPAWLQAMRQVVLALPSKNSKDEPTNLNRKGSEDRMADEVDDEASFAGPKQELNTKQKLSSCTATKVFAVSCVQLLLEQVPEKHSSHFQPDVSSPNSDLPPEKRFISHLELLVGIAVNAASSDEVSLSAAGLRLMLLVVGRFQHTKDVQGQVEGVDCPLLLVQFEAQMTTCIRHNLRASANPSVVRLALELLREVIAVGACTSTHRLIALLMQPLSSQTFEPDPLFSEAASTGCFLFRLRCACAVLDSGQSQEQAAVAAYSKHLSRWIENALRDSAVLLAGLPLQSVKSYQPTCFSFADYKAIQPLFREAVPSLLRGVCVLSTEEPTAKKSSPSSMQSKSSSWALSRELVSLSLGIVVTLLADASLEDITVFLSTTRHLLILSSQTCDDEGAVISLASFMDVLSCIWKEVFCRQKRCEALLVNLMELIHGISGALWKAQRNGRQTSQEASELPWLEGLWHPEGEASKAILDAYAFHIVAATMKKADVTDSHLTMALEVFQWWLQDALSRTDSDEAESKEDEELNRLMNQALAEDEDVAPSSGETCPWFWLLLKPLPETLVQSHPAVTLKHWKQICILLSSHTSTSSSHAHLLRLVLISNTLCASVIRKLDDTSITEASERQLVYSFATLVPAITAMATLLRATNASEEASEGLAEEAVEGAEHASASAQKCLDRLKELFDMAWLHPSVKVVQAAVSSAQNLFQTPACSDLYRVLMPGLIDAIAMEPPKMAPLAMEHAWGIFPTLLSAQSQSGDAKLVKSSTQLLLHLVCALAEFSKLQPGGAGKTAMANCLMQAAQIEPTVKAEIVNLPAESQRTVQELLRAHVNAGRADASAGNIPRVPLAHKKIELKLKF